MVKLADNQIIRASGAHSHRTGRTAASRRFRTIPLQTL